MQSSSIQIEQCDRCKTSCRARFSTCQSTIKSGKIFPLCSNNIDRHGKLDNFVSDIVQIANTAFDSTDNQTILFSELDGLRRLYEEGMNKDAMGDGHVR